MGGVFSHKLCYGLVCLFKSKDSDGARHLEVQQGGVRTRANIVCAKGIITPRSPSCRAVPNCGGCCGHTVQEVSPSRKELTIQGYDKRQQVNTDRCTGSTRRQCRPA